MAFSTAASSFFTPLQSFTQAKFNPNSSLSCPSMAFVVPSIKTSFASSNSAFFRHGFLQLSSHFSGFTSNSNSPSSAAIFARATTEKSVHDFAVKDIDRKDVSLSKFKGKVLLIVNVASRWY